MAITPLLQHQYPNENQDPHYTTLANFFNQNDITMWNNRLRSMFILAGGGSLVWDYTNNFLTWTSNFAVKDYFSGYKIEYVNGPTDLTREAVIYDGEFLYGQFSSQMTTDQLKNLKVSNRISSADNVFVLAWRYGNKLYFCNGTIL